MKIGHSDDISLDELLWVVLNMLIEKLFTETSIYGPFYITSHIWWLKIYLKVCMMYLVQIPIFCNIVENDRSFWILSSACESNIICDL